MQPILLPKLPEAEIRQPPLPLSAHLVGHVAIATRRSESTESGAPRRFALFTTLND